LEDLFIEEDYGRLRTARELEGKSLNIDHKISALHSTFTGDVDLDVLQAQDEKIGLDRNNLIIACIPALNEERTISSIILLARKYVDEVLVCDDGSSDNTSELAKEAGAIVFEHSMNLGKGASLKTLFKAALERGAEIIITLDADGQHNPCQIPDLFKPIIDKKADIVIGSRYHKDSENKAPLYRKFGASILNYLTSGKSNIKDTQSGFRAFSNRSAKEMINVKAKGYGAESEQIIIASRKEFNIIEVPIDVIYKNIIKSSKKNPLTHGIEVIGTIILARARNLKSSIFPIY
jgi:glycosyltransferase involved in cell wall biosynthesis